MKTTTSGPLLSPLVKTSLLSYRQLWPGQNWITLSLTGQFNFYQTVILKRRTCSNKLINKYNSQEKSLNWAISKKEKFLFPQFSKLWQLVICPLCSIFIRKMCMCDCFSDWHWTKLTYPFYFYAFQFKLSYDAECSNERVPHSLGYLAV